MYTAGFLAVVNITIIYLALPQIEAKLHAGIDDQQWILSIYPLMEGGFTLASGVLGDLYGRRRVLAASTWLFVLSTLACAVAPDAGMLIVARGVQGIASAALLSLPLAILLELDSSAGGNVRTVQAFATVAGLGAGFAPLIGGALVSWFGWMAVFYFSALLGIAVLAGVHFAPEQSGDSKQRLDTGGQVTSILGCLAISYAFIQGNTSGYGSPEILTAFAVAAVCAVLFLAIERRAAQPMIDLSYFRLPRFNAALLIVAIVNFGWYGLMLLCTLFLQEVLNLREIAVGLYLMPCNAAYFAANLYSGQLARLLGISATVALSFALSLGGMVWLALLNVHAAPWQVAGALALAGLGWGVISTPAAAMGMAAVRDRDEGFASGTLALSRSLFGVFGIAVLGSLLSGGMTARIAQGLRTLRVPESYKDHVLAAVHHGGIFEIPGVGGLVDGAYVSALRVSVGACFVLTVLFGAWILATLRSAQSESSSSAAAYS